MSGPREAARTIAETLRDAAQRLADTGIDTARLDARVLLAHALGCATEDIVRDLNQIAPPSDFESLLARRVARVPLAQITGSREFWSLRFRVSPVTLVPRPDSETVVEAALRACPDRDRAYRVLDLGCGTGCLLLAFLSERPAAFGIGVDRVAAAAALTRHNALDLGLRERSAFLCGDWAEAVASRFDLVLSNPPYIETAALVDLMPEVRDHEPLSALDGGADGLAAYRAIIAAMSGLLTPTGVAVFELGLGQDVAVSTLADAAGFSTDRALDLSGVTRALSLRIGP